MKITGPSELTQSTATIYKNNFTPDTGLHFFPVKTELTC
nr:MAG TPA: hypothetical protein [Caudoviricetes sp.]